VQEQEDSWQWLGQQHHLQQWQLSQQPLNLAGKVLPPAAATAPAGGIAGGSIFHGAQLYDAMLATRHR
jgi:hypothetical protein